MAQLLKLKIADKRSDQIYKGDIGGVSKIQLLETEAANKLTLASTGGSADVSALIAADFIDQDSVSYGTKAANNNSTGVFVSADAPRSAIVKLTGEAVLTTNGKEVYGKITESSGVLTLTFYTLKDDGTDLAVNIDAGDYLFSYPAQITSEFISIRGDDREFLHVDPGANGTTLVEEVTVTGAIAAGDTGDLATASLEVKSNSLVQYTLSNSVERKILVDSTQTGNTLTGGAGTIKADKKTIEFDTSKARAVEATEKCIIEYVTLQA